MYQARGAEFVLVVTPSSPRSVNYKLYQAGHLLYSLDRPVWLSDVDIDPRRGTVAGLGLHLTQGQDFSPLELPGEPFRLSQLAVCSIDPAGTWEELSSTEPVPAMDRGVAPILRTWSWVLRNGSLTARLEYSRGTDAIVQYLQYAGPARRQAEHSDPLQWGSTQLRGRVVPGTALRSWFCPAADAAPGRWLLLTPRGGLLVHELLSAEQAAQVQFSRSADGGSRISFKDWPHDWCVDPPRSSLEDWRVHSLPKAEEQRPECVCRIERSEWSSQTPLAWPLEGQGAKGEWHLGMQSAESISLYFPQTGTLFSTPLAKSSAAWKSQAVPLPRPQLERSRITSVAWLAAQKLCVVHSTVSGPPDHSLSCFDWESGMATELRVPGARDLRMLAVAFDGSSWLAAGSRELYAGTGFGDGVERIGRLADGRIVQRVLGVATDGDRLHYCVEVNHADGGNEAVLCRNRLRGSNSEIYSIDAAMRPEPNQMIALEDRVLWLGADLAVRELCLRCSRQRLVEELSMLPKSNVMAIVAADSAGSFLIGAEGYGVQRVRVVTR